MTLFLLFAAPELAALALAVAYYTVTLPIRRRWL